MLQKIVPRTVEHVACVMAKRIAQKFVKRHCANPVQKTVLAAGIHQAVEDAHLGRTDAPLAHPVLGRKRRQGKAFPCFPKGKQDASWRDSPWLTMVQKHARGGCASRKGALGHPALQIQFPLRPHPVKNYVRQADRLGAGLKKLLPSAERTLHQAHNLMAAFQRDPAPPRERTIC